MTERKVKPGGLPEHTKDKHTEVYSLCKDDARSLGPKSLNEAKAAWRP